MSLEELKAEVPEPAEPPPAPTAPETPQATQDISPPAAMPPGAEED